MWRRECRGRRQFGQAGDMLGRWRLHCHCSHHQCCLRWWTEWSLMSGSTERCCHRGRSCRHCISQSMTCRCFGKCRSGLEGSRSSGRSIVRRQGRSGSIPAMDLDLTILYSPRSSDRYLSRLVSCSFLQLIEQADWDAQGRRRATLQEQC